MDELNQQFNLLITDSQELEAVLDRFDFDAELEQEINKAISEYQQLQIDFKAFIKLRSVINQ